MSRKKTTQQEFTDVAHDVWLAGLGALAAAGQEGEKLFKSLVARGAKVEKKVVRPVDQAGDRLRSTVTDVRSRASKTFGSLQTTIDDSVSAALARIGVPTRGQIASLSRRVEKLTRAVDGNGTRKGTRKKAAKKKTAKKKTTAKKTARKRVAKKKTRSGATRRTAR